LASAAGWVVNLWGCWRGGYTGPLTCPRELPADRGSAGYLRRGAV